MMDAPDWTNGEHLANIAAEELTTAMAMVGIGYLNVGGGEDGSVTITFPSLADAEALLTLAVVENQTPGSLYDRATHSCVSLTEWAATGYEPTDDQLAATIFAGWEWEIHPSMNGRRMGWHVHVEMTSADANQLTANLHALRLGGI